MAAVNLAKAWGNGEGIAHMTLSEAKQQFDEETLRLLDPAAYHELKAQEREEVIRGYIADDQQRQVLSRAATEERSREVLRDMLTTSNQIAYHDFKDRLDTTGRVLDEMKREHQIRLRKFINEYNRLVANGLDIGDGHHAFLNEDGTEGTDEFGNRLTDEQMAVAREQRKTHPNATTPEQLKLGFENLEREVAMGAHIDHYRQELEILQKTMKPAEGDPDYAARMEAYNKKWAELLKALPEKDRAAAFAENKDAEAVYNKYKDQVGAMRLHDNVAEPASPENREATAALVEAATGAQVTPAVAVPDPDQKPAKKGLSGTFESCIRNHVLAGEKDEAVCYGSAPEMSEMASKGLTPDFSAVAGNISDMKAQLAGTQPMLAQPATDAMAEVDAASRAKTPKVQAGMQAGG